MKNVDEFISETKSTHQSFSVKMHRMEQGICIHRCFSLRYIHIFLPSVKNTGAFFAPPRKGIHMNQEIIMHIEEKIGYRVKSWQLLEQAFIRAGYANENKGVLDYQLLEHVGDKWLEIAVHLAIMKHLTARDEQGRLYSAYTKHEMSILEDRIVKNDYLSERMRLLGLSDYLIMSTGERNQDCLNNDSTHYKLFEAIVGVVAVDTDYCISTISQVILRMMGFDNWSDLLDDRAIR